MAGVELNIKTKVDISNAEKATDTVEKAAKKSGDAVGGLTNQLDKMTGGAISGFKGMAKGVMNGVKGLKSFKVALASTGIGLLIVAVGSLVTYFTKTQDGADKLNKAFAVIGATVDVLIDRISSFGSGLFEIMSGNFSAGLDILAGSFKGITTEIEKEAKAAYELEGANQDLIKTKRAFIEQEAKLNADLEKYRLASENFDLSTAERLKANGMAQKTAMELANKRTAIAKEELRVLSEKNALGNSMNDDLEAEAEAKAKLFEIEGQRDALAKEFQAKAKSITDEQKSASAARAAEIAAQEKERLAKESEEKKAAAEKLAKEIEDARLEAIRKGDNDIRQYKLDNEKLETERLLEFYQRQRDLELEALDLTEAEKESIRLSYKEKEKAAIDEVSKKAKAAAKEEEDIEKAKASMKMSFAQQGLSIIQEAAGKGTKIAKAAAVAQATIAGVQSVVNAFNSANANIGATAGSFGAYPIAMASAAGAFSALQIKKILSTSTSGGGASAPSVSSGGTASTPTVPDFNFVNQGVGNTDNSSLPTARAYVVNQDIKDQSALDSRINDLAKI